MRSNAPEKGLRELARAKILSKYQRDLKRATRAGRVWFRDSARITNGIGRRWASRS
jgi:hypothetical protein